jgi:RNA 3'-terminal phosphate cyclase (ATP)
MAWSPPFDYVRDVWLPMLSRLGVEASVELANWGWYPVGKGEVRVRIRGLGSSRAMLKPLETEERGPLLRISGRAVAANFPAHIPQRMADRARSLLAVLGADLFIEPLRHRRSRQTLRASR